MGSTLTGAAFVGGAAGHWTGPDLAPAPRARAVVNVIVTVGWTLIDRRHLRSTPDADVLEIAAQQGRVLVTDNVQDFAPLSSSWAAAGRAHPGILMIASKTFPMTRARSGLIAAALLKRHSSHTWPAPGQFEFLSPEPVALVRPRKPR